MTVGRVDQKLVVKVKGRYPGSNLAVINIQSTSELIQPHHMLLDKSNTIIILKPLPVTLLTIS